MSPERWNKILDLFHAACEKRGDARTALLESVSSSDPSLRMVVEQMLREHEASGSFLKNSLLAAFFSQKDPARVATAGRKFGHYELLGPIGRGGMGEVWAAHDAELERPVALKFLTGPTFGRAADRLTVEAKTVSALNHPNVVTVHEVISHEDGPIIVMELVDGISLREICGTPQPVPQLINIGVQIARALAVAHERSIVHRDIKPENILVRRDGYVKVVDFGLARYIATGKLAPGSDQPKGATLPGGTLRYMSPEQARGEQLSPASDIFSLGLVLHELATGRHAFRGDSPAEVMQTILSDQAVAPSSLNGLVSASFDSLVLAMLAKDPEARPSAQEVAIKLASGLGITQLMEQVTPPARGNRRLWPIVVVASLFVICGIGWLLFGRRESPQFADLSIRPLTSQTGWEWSPVFSPDGKSIAFTWTEKLSEARQIYVKQLNNNPPVQLTHFHSENDIGFLAWSPDGKWIAFKREYPSFGALIVIPSSGGDEKKVLELKSPHLSSSIDWSPDGSQLAFSELVPNSNLFAIYLFNLRTDAKRKLTSPPHNVTGDASPKFSPDGRSIAFKRVDGFWADDLYVVPVSGGPLQRITWERRGIWGHAWTADGKSLIVSCQRASTLFALWRYPVTSRDRPERMVQGGGDAIIPAASPKTTRMAWVSQLQDINIYRMSAAGKGQPEKLIASTLRDQAAAYSPGGWIAFVSDRTGSREIWKARADGSDQVRITNFNGRDIGDLQWSRDGRRLAFYSRAQGHSDIFSLDCDPAAMSCGNPKPVTEGIKAEVPTWSADGKFLYFASDQTGRWEVWRQSAFGGGQPIRVTYNGGYAARESLDGKWLYFSKDRSDSIWRIPMSQIGNQRSAGEELVIGPPNNVQQKAWALIPDGIVFIDRGRNGQPEALRACKISTKAIRLILPLTESFADPRDYSLSVSADSRRLLYSQLDRSGSDIMVADYGH